MATERPVTGDEGWGTTYEAYEAISHNSDGTLKLIGSEDDGQTAPDNITTGFQFFAINGVSTKVYTKCLTGALVGFPSTTSVDHGLDSVNQIVSIVLQASTATGSATMQSSTIVASFSDSVSPGKIVITSGAGYTEYVIKIEYTA